MAGKRRSQPAQIRINRHESRAPLAWPELLGARFTLGLVGRRPSVLIFRELAAHLGGVLIGVEAGQEVERRGREVLTTASMPAALEGGFIERARSSRTTTQARLGAGIHAHDVRLAAERGDAGGGFARGVGVAQLRLNARRRAAP